MIDEIFLAECRKIDPSAEVDREKSLDAIRAQILKEEEQNGMLKNKRFRRPAVAAALLAGVLSLTAAVYAASPLVWRYFDTSVVQGQEFVTDLFIGEVDLPDGTTSVGGSIKIDREALEAAGGGAVIIDVDGEEWVVLDELHLDSLDEGMELLQLDALLPDVLPDGFHFSRFTFSVNPNIHRYAFGEMPAAQSARIYFSNDADEVISFTVNAMPDDMALGILDGQQGLLINGKQAVLSGSILTDEQLASFTGITLLDAESFDTDAPAVAGSHRFGLPHLNVLHDGISYSFFTLSRHVTAYDLVRMAQSMK